MIPFLYLGLYRTKNYSFTVSRICISKNVCQTKTVKGKTLKILNLVVDDMLDIRNIKTTSCNICCQEDTAEKVTKFNEHKIEE